MRSERVNPHFWTFSNNSCSPFYYFYYNFSATKLDISKHLEKCFISKWIENPVYIYNIRNEFTIQHISTFQYKMGIQIEKPLF